MRIREVQTERFIMDAFGIFYEYFPLFSQKKRKFFIFFILLLKKIGLRPISQSLGCQYANSSGKKKHWRARSTRRRQSKKAYFEAIADSKRTDITREELCDADWCFRFNKVAGEDWISTDPYWTTRVGEPLAPRKVRFTRGGSVVWNGHRQMRWPWQSPLRGPRQDRGRGAEGALPSSVPFASSGPTLQLRPLPVYYYRWLDQQESSCSNFRLPRPPDLRLVGCCLRCSNEIDSI